MWYSQLWGDHWNTNWSVFLFWFFFLFFRLFRPFHALAFPLVTWKLDNNQPIETAWQNRLFPAAFLFRGVRLCRDKSSSQNPNAGAVLSCHLPLLWRPLETRETCIVAASEMFSCPLHSAYCIATLFNPLSWQTMWCMSEYFEFSQKDCLLQIWPHTSSSWTAI